MLQQHNIPAEAAYFDGDHCQHVADQQAHQLREHRRKQALEAISRRPSHIDSFMATYNEMAAEAQRTGFSNLPGDGGWSVAL